MVAIVLASAVVFIVPKVIKIWLEIVKLCLELKEKFDARKKVPVDNK